MQRTVAILILALVAAAGLWTWFGAAPGSPQPGLSSGATPGAHPGPHAEQQPDRGRSTTAEPPSNRQSPDVGERTVGRARSAPSGVQQPVRVLDAATGVPIAAAFAITPTVGEIVARADGDGRMVLDRAVDDVVFVAPDYWVGFVGAGSAQPKNGTERRVELVADRYTLPWRFEFVGADGQPVAGAKFRLRSLDEPPPTATGVPSERAGATGRAEAKIQRAWQAHTAMCSLPAVERHVAFHLGVVSGARRFAADTTGRAEVRFLASGAYLLEARAGQAVGRGVIEVRLRQEQDQRIELVAGRTLSIEVVDASSGRPIADAKLTPRELPLGVDGVATAANGVGALAPLPGAPITVDVTHPDFGAGVVGPLRPTADGKAVVVRLVPKPRRVVRGVVRELGSKRPVAGARVAAVDLGDVRLVVETGADGAFELPTRLTECELRILSDDHQDYAEFIETQTAPTDYSLIPKATAARVRVGLTSVVRGKVVDAAGVPQPGTPVRWYPAADRMPQGMVGRRIIRGGVLMLPSWSTADAAGRFELECAVFGAGRLLAVVGTTGPEAGLPLELAAGTERDGLSLLAKK